MNIKKIGFIGIGVMGSSMAKHLQDAGFELGVYTRTKAKAQELLEKGMKWYDTPAALAAEADAIISMVGYPQDVEEVYLGEQGVLSTKVGGYIVDMTTSSPILARKIYEAARAKGISSLDAPVSGGDLGARNATLAIMVGGDEEAFQALLPVFQAMGKTSSKQQCGRFAQDSTNGQDAAGNYAIQTVRQDYRADHPPLACSQTESTFPVGLGHGFQAFLSVSHNGRQVHNGQCQGTRC